MPKTLLNYYQTNAFPGRSTSDPRLRYLLDKHIKVAMGDLVAGRIILKMKKNLY
jgi:hypothetical protein